MMKQQRITLMLIVLFFVSLLAFWGLERFGVLTEKERRLRESRLLPDLLGVTESEISRLTIERGQERLAFERRPKASGRWQMVEPLDVAAEPMRLESLVRTLRDLRPSPDSGKLTGDPAMFGLATPAATVKLFASSSRTAGQAAEPIATLEVGKAVRGTRYVRAGHEEGIDTVDAKRLAAVDLPLADWRQPVVMGVVTFEVEKLSIKRAGQIIAAKRDQHRRWKLTEPVKTPANPAKIESLLAALAALRVVKGAEGYVAENVKDFAPFGLDHPAITVELVTNRPGDEPRVLEVGKPVPGHEDRVYVRQGDQDDVVAVEARALNEIPPDAIPLRSKQVIDVEPSNVTRIEVAAQSTTFAIEKSNKTDWQLTRPRKEKADRALVSAFLGQLDRLETAEFYKPNQIRNTGLNPPLLTIKVWEKDSDEPSAQLLVGQYNLGLQTVFAQLPGDQYVLGLPKTLADVLPKNTFAFRDRAILTENPTAVQKLVIRRGGQTLEVEPDKNGAPNEWKMLRPVAAKADAPTVTKALAVLTGLRADQFISDSVGDGKLFGLDQPTREISWLADRPHTLKVGGKAARTSNYADLEGSPMVFTLSDEVLAFFDAEFHDHVVDSFPIMSAERMLFRWHNRTVALRRRPETKDRLAWVDEPGSDIAGLDLSRADAIATALSRLETMRFYQYEGSIPASSGLLRPRLVVEVDLGPKQPNRVLRIGYSNPDGSVFAAMGTGDTGAVFFLPGAAWDALIASGQRFAALPENVFAPAR